MNELEAYATKLFSLLDEEKFFEKAGLFMDRDIMKKFLMETLEDNFEKTGSFELHQDQLSDVIDRTNSYIIEETFCDLIKTGDIRPVGLDENGDFLYESVVKQKK